MQPTAQAVGGKQKQNQAPEERKKMSHTCGNILLHVIFSTYERHPLIKSEFREDLFSYMAASFAK